MLNLFTCLCVEDVWGLVNKRKTWNFAPTLITFLNGRPRISSDSFNSGIPGLIMFYCWANFWESRAGWVETNWDRLNPKPLIPCWISRGFWKFFSSLPPTQSRSLIFRKYFCDASWIFLFLSFIPNCVLMLTAKWDFCWCLFSWRNGARKHLKSIN